MAVTASIRNVLKVRVTDGRPTILGAQAAGGRNAKLCFIELLAIPSGSS